MIIYKYVPTARFFSNFKFRLTPAKDLNDKRELVPDIRLRNPASYASNIVARNLEATYWRLQITEPSVEPRVIWQRILAAAEVFVSNFDEDNVSAEIYDMVMRVANRNVGVLSLTDDPFSDLMWAHYADNHKGFVIGLDSESAFFRPKPGEPRPCGELMNVIYTDTTPVVYVEPGKLDIPKELYFVKTTKWSYEREWRMIKYLPMADEVLDADGKKIHLFEVPVDAVKELYIGPDAIDAQKIEDLVRASAPNVSIKNVRVRRGGTLGCP